MSRSLYKNRALEKLEPYEGKLSRTVLRGVGSSNAPDLLDLFIEDSEENLNRFEKQARNMHSLARYSRSNQINEAWIQEYLNLARSQGLTSIRAHFNVLAWSDDAEELKHIKNDVGSQLASMECVPRHNTIDCPTLYWAAMPGNAADFPAELRELLTGLSTLNWAHPAPLSVRGATLMAAERIVLAHVQELTGHPLRSLDFLTQLT